MKASEVVILLFPISIGILFAPLFLDVILGGLPNNHLTVKEFCESQGYSQYTLQENLKEGACFEINGYFSEIKFKCITKNRPWIAEIDKCAFIKEEAKRNE